MGNGIRKLKHCFTGRDVREISKRSRDITVQNSDHLDIDDRESLGYDSFFFNDSSGTVFSNSDASISTTLSPLPSVPLFNYYLLARFIQGTSIGSARSGPIARVSSSGSGLTEREFHSGSGPFEREFHSGSGSGPTEREFHSGSIEQSFITLPLEGNVQLAQGKEGENKVHTVLSEEHKWVFIGIYDGFNGPYAADFLLNNLYPNLFKELKGFLQNDKLEISKNSMIDENLNSLGTNGAAGVGHFDILKALSEALRKTEASYTEIVDIKMNENSELALMGSCVLVMLLNDKDVYLMNIGDSRAILAQNLELDGLLDSINEESIHSFNSFDKDESNFTSCQLTMDHSISIKEEVLRIRNEHPDDASVLQNDRVKGSLKVTRAFGACYLKEPKWNNALLDPFRIDYVGNSPYINCLPSLYHHELGPIDKFLILSSGGLYQFFTNEEAVSEVESFMSIFPEGDPSQHLVDEVLFKAAKKAGIDFHVFLDIPPGDRRRYHDEVSIIIISFEGKIWKSSV